MSDLHHSVEYVSYLSSVVCHVDLSHRGPFVCQTPVKSRLHVFHASAEWLWCDLANLPSLKAKGSFNRRPLCPYRAQGPRRESDPRPSSFSLDNGSLGHLGVLLHGQQTDGLIQLHMDSCSPSAFLELNALFNIVKKSSK